MPITVSFDATPLQDAALKAFFAQHPELGDVQTYISQQISNTLDLRVADFLNSDMAAIIANDPNAIVAFLSTYQAPK